MTIEDKKLIAGEVKRLNGLFFAGVETTKRAEQAEAKLADAQLAFAATEAKLSAALEEIERLKDSVKVSRRWSKTYKALAIFRGWPASKHEETRRRAEAAEAENERLRKVVEAAADVADGAGLEFSDERVKYESWQLGRGDLEALRAALAAYETSRKEGE